eukprot:g21854.t1
MTKAADLITAKEGIALREANQILSNSKKGKLPIVNPAGEIDQNKNLLAAAAVSVLADDRKERVKALVEAGTDAIVFDNRPGDNEDQLEIIRWTKSEFPKMQVIGGNVVTRRQAKNLLDPWPAFAPTCTKVGVMGTRKFSDISGSDSAFCVVLGAQWGDEGKGKLVDILAQAQG